MTDYYDILEVPTSASKEEIKKAYRRLCRQHHPDLHNGAAWAEEQFKLINEAYEVLSDTFKRQAYDVAYFEQAQQESQVTTNWTTSSRMGDLMTFFKQNYTIGFGVILLLLFAASIISLTKSSTRYQDTVIIGDYDKQEQERFLIFCKEHPGLLSPQEFNTVLSQPLPNGLTYELKRLAIQQDTAAIRQLIGSQFFNLN